MSDYDPGLDAIMRTDRFVDALASGARMSSVDPLSAMLGEWRDDVRRRPDAPVVTMAHASMALAQVQKPPRRNRIALTVIGGAAAAVLALGGFGAVVLDAKPGDALYGLRSTLFGERTESRSAAVTLAAQELDQVQQLVNQGNWDEAQQKLLTLGPTVQNLSDVQSKQQLVQQYNSLTAKVIQRDPQATLPPPGQPPPVNPSSPLTFLQVPAVTETTTSPSTPGLGTTSGPTTPPTTSLPTPSSPLPSSPLPTPSSPLPTPTGVSPTPMSPLATTTVASPAPTSPLPTPSSPLPTPSSPLPTPTGASPPPTSAPPTTAPPTVARTAVSTASPTAQATATTTAAQAPPSQQVTVTTPPVTQSTAAPPPEATHAAPAPETTHPAPPPEAPKGPQRPPVVITTPTQAPGGSGPR